MGEITAPSTTGSLAGATDNYDQLCQSSTGKDVTYDLNLPVAVSHLRIDTVGSPSDTVLSFWNALCTTQIACDDDSGGLLDSLIVRTNVPAGHYAIQVDMFDGASNPTGYTLNVSGTAAAGAACTDPLFAAGVLLCPTACTSGVCE